ncbi:RNA binding protein [Favolaschia claudopus]|uniref:RNA binding protein n=1 Tax=Favolaschia claudopus TaxID=2862362 RepID=A0AAW0EIL1_9AGAR
MPPKTASRTWGTRFDTLPSSPPPSPHPREVALETDNVSATDNNTDAFNHKKVEKMPHDASVFVGSLPTNIEHSELSRMLSEHLSDHAEVKSIKLVKDSKGGVCAFVQCENADAAASLIHTLHSNAPKHFLGRVLRYEPARAFRTLLISYRTPVQSIPSDDRKGGSQIIQLDPPLAMRIWRPRNTKYLNIAYNTEAVDIESQSNILRDSAGNPGLFFQPVVFDETTIQSLCSHFGPLESFGRFKAPEVAQEGGPDVLFNRPRFPQPHDAPRLPNMDAGCWEVKWNHRDDSVSALMTLRRVPHLTATWAHQPPPFEHQQHHGRFAPNHHNNGISYPFHAQNFVSPTKTHTESSLASSHSANLSRTSQGSTAPGSGLQDSSVDMSFSTNSTNSDDWKRIVVPSLPTQSYDSSASFRSPCFRESAPKDSTTEWTDIDFPPLGDCKVDPRDQVWPKKAVKDGESQFGEEPPCSLSVVTEDVDGKTNPSANQDAEQDQELDIPDTPGLAMSPITPKTAGSQFPSTPTSTNGDFSQEKNIYFDDNKDLDPTSLFVGGLEMNWDEERVTSFFRRFGGLESVQVVKPMSGRSAFAFVKFNNTESPARAVFEEHNRVHDGRAIRVQLRDCNPPRGGNWRYNGVRRGRFPPPHYPQRRYPEPPPNRYDEQLAPDGHDNDHIEHHPYVTEDALNKIGGLSLADGNTVEASVLKPMNEIGTTAYTGDQETQPIHQIREDQTQSCPTSRRSTPKIAPEQYREWYDPPASTGMTPPIMPSPTSSAAVPGAPYAHANGGFFPPPWTQPFPQPYGVPYYPGFVPYPVQGTHPPSQPFSSPPASETGEQASGASLRPWPPMGMYGGYISYPAYPRPATGDPSSSPRGQAPLQPTGFIQNEQGTLIPVYQPEALDQYMSSNQGAPAAATPPIPPQNGTPTWPQFAPPAHLFPNPISPMMNVPPRPFPPHTQPNVNGAWIPNQFPVPHAGPPPHSPLPANAHNHTGYFRNGHHDMGGQGLGPNNRRHPGGRRDHHPNSQNSRNPGRAMPNNRHPRGGLHSMGYPPHEVITPMQPLPRPAQLNPTPADWNKWTVVR